MTENDLLDPNPFANSLLATQGNELARDIYTDVGFALDRWEHCDESFAVLYSALINPQGSNHTTLRAFGALSASNTKREMIWHACDAFFATYPNEDLWSRTRHLLNLHKHAAARRNEIAHAMVMGESRYKVVDNVAQPLPTIWFLVPPLFATRKQELHLAGPKYRYSTIEIDHFRLCFEELSARVCCLTTEIRQFYAAMPQEDG